MYAHSEQTVVGRELNLKFYEEVLRPALVMIDAEQFGHWPPSYTAAERTARDSLGQYHFGTVDIPVENISELVVEMKLLMANIREFAGAFFYHEARGMKGGSVHDPGDDDDARAALDEVCDVFDWNAITPEMRNQFYIDIGIEIRRPGHVVQWRRKHHKNIIRTLLPSATDAQCKAVIESPTFMEDPASQLSEYAGFRVPLRTRGQGEGIVYMNLYCTEKQVHYQLHKGVFSRKKPADLLG